MYEVDWRKFGKVTSHFIDEKSADTQFIFLVDQLATRYSKLPSEILQSGDTFDMMVYDVVSTYTKHIQSKQKGNVDSSMYDQDQLLEKLQKHR